MTKSGLIQLVARQYPHIRRVEVEKIVNIMLGEIVHMLSLGNRVELRGFGAFSVKTHDARQARNPRNGDTVSVPSKRVPNFKTGKDLHVRLNTPRRQRESDESAGIESVT